jgi:hypothetical protein
LKVKKVSDKCDTVSAPLLSRLLQAIHFVSFQRYPTDQAYFIAKEILMTERTYKKDLEIINLVSDADASFLKRSWRLREKLAPTGKF